MNESFKEMNLFTGRLHHLLQSASNVIDLHILRPLISVLAFR
jgi:hypothetical protein